MEIKCSLDNNFYNYSFAPRKKAEPSFRGARTMVLTSERSADRFMRPVANKIATGLLSLENTFINIANNIKNYFVSYKRNIVHTYEHRVAFAYAEKKIFGS